MDKLINNKKGFSTIELMIAMAIMVLVLSAVIVVSFGNQSYLIGSQTNAEAMKIAQGVIEQEQALARKDFNLVNPVPETPDGIYTESVTVKLLPDFLTKEVKTLVSWKDEHQTDRNLELTTLITNFENPAGGNTCDSTLSGNPEGWKNPQVESTIDFSSITPTGTYTLTDVDAYKNKLYVTAGKTTNIGDPTLFIFDISDPDHPSLLGKVDNASTVSSGLNAVRVAEDLSSDQIYAYAASNSGSDYSSCKPVSTYIDPDTDALVTTEDSACGQLVVFDVTDSRHPKKNANLKISSTPAVTGQPSTGQVKGESIFYKNGYILLGLTATDGPEFHLIDVHKPSLLTSGSVTSVGSFEVGNGVNAISMRGNYVYLATPDDNKELNILNISNPSVPLSAGSFDAPGGGGNFGNGKSLTWVGDSLYLGRTSSSANDFYILDNSTPSTFPLPELKGMEIGSSVNNIIVRDYLSFLLIATPSTGSQLKIFRTDKLTNITSWGTKSLSSTSNTTEPSMDCEGNRLYISSNDSTGKGSIYVVGPGE